jgi:hypothetical protein
MAYLGWILRIWPNAAWYAGRLGTIVRIQDCAIAAPNRYLAGAMRAEHIRSCLARPGFHHKRQRETVSVWEASVIPQATRHA